MKLRIRSRRNFVAPPLCPEHGVSMRVGRTVGQVQYRYCMHPGCTQSCRTIRQPEKAALAKDRNLTPRQWPLGLGRHLR
jgi:hypothetical protein